MENNNLLDFHPYRPCQIPDEHVGREVLLEHAFGRLGADDAQSFVLIGAPKIGKTSFLNYLRHPQVFSNYLDNPENYWFIYLNAEDENLSSIFADEQSFFHALFDELTSLAKRDLSIEISWQDSNDLTEIALFLKEKNKNLILIVDNFNLIITNPNYKVTFYESLRSWFSTHNQISSVLSSPIHLLQLAMPLELSGSPFFNIFSAYLLEPLTLEESHKLLSQRLLLQTEDKQINYLIKNFGYTPYTLQQVGFIWNDFAKNGYISDIDLVVEKTYQKCLFYYEELYSDLSQHLPLIIEVIENKISLDIDNTLIEYGVINEKTNDFCALQTKRFFEEKTNIKKNNFFNKAISFFYSFFYRYFKKI